MKNYFKNKLIATFLTGVALSMTVLSSAQEGEPSIKLSIIEDDSLKICKAVVMTDSTPVEGTDVNFYIKRNFGLLPLALTETTDENGEATAEFNISLPGDTLGNITIIAQLDDDDAIADQLVVPWGTKTKYETQITQKALWASRANAPLYLIIIANAIIIGIWGTMGYVLYLLFFKMKKAGLDYNP